MCELLLGLTEYFAFYNNERSHQVLRNRTPDVVRQRAEGSGAMIVDNYGATQELPIALRSTETTFNDVNVQISAIPNAITGAAPSSCVCNRVRLKLPPNLS